MIGFKLSILKADTMKQPKLVDSKIKILMLVLILGIPLFIFTDASLTGSLLETPEASAQSQYGILGQMAPELGPLDWIDGNGDKIDPVRLSDLRGKVVYLYFFQDW